MVHLSTLMNVGAPVGPVTYTWSFGDGQNGTSTESTMNHTYAIKGTYAVRVQATDSSEHTGEATTTVAVQAPPAAPVDPAPVTPLPPSLAVTLTCTAAAARDTVPCNVSATFAGGTVLSSDITRVAWDWGDGQTEDSYTGPLRQHVYNQRGTYTVTATVTATTIGGVLTARTTQTLVIK